MTQTSVPLHWLFPPTPESNKFSHRHNPPSRALLKARFIKSNVFPSSANLIILLKNKKWARLAHSLLPRGLTRPNAYDFISSQTHTVSLHPLFLRKEGWKVMVPASLPCPSLWSCRKIRAGSSLPLGFCPPLLISSENQLNAHWTPASTPGGPVSSITRAQLHVRMGFPPKLCIPATAQHDVLWWVPWDRRYYT